MSNGARIKTVHSFFERIHQDKLVPSTIEGGFSLNIYGKLTPSDQYMVQTECERRLWKAMDKSPKEVFEEIMYEFWQDPKMKFYGFNADREIPC